ncbi:hypothetical protein [Acidisphaera rubrifaciens]|uniref:DUF2125 domain-containing protein n=1 Tax=Acidisphaera rubrifaciens HS-AP3 TaxID=1231350 RepID=A0A0D6P5A2_9PROT|nr:hypothetical protein [Acidisphaera rubrifaciens]GAN76940.1 hypothetical protein Asru_0195_06 [Acidisphaera rubrifaciens HS-AP3]
MSRRIAVRTTALFGAPLLGAALLLAGIAPARAAPAPDRCTAFAADFDRATVAHAQAIGPDACRFHDVAVRTDGPAHLHIDTVTVQHIDFDRAARHALQPALHVVLTGARFAGPASRPLTSYIMSVTARVFDAVLDYRYDPRAGTLVVSQLAISGPHLGGLTMSGAVDGVTPAAVERPGAAAASGIRLRRLSLRLANDGLVEAFVVPPLAGWLLAGAPDPAARVAEMKPVAVLYLMATLGRMGVPNASIAALVQFITDMPHPRPTLTVEGRFDPPLSVADMAAIAAGQPPAPVPGRQLTVSYP